MSHPDMAETTELSGVTMGWLLRLVTGGPLVVGGPRQFYFILNQRGGALTLESDGGPGWLRYASDKT